MGLWGGRFNEPSDQDLRKLNDSLPFDQRFYKQDIAGSIAYAKAIREAGIISPEEASQLLDGLNQISLEFEQGNFSFQEADEDIHTAVERRLIEIIGDVGGKLHTGRSRNDQVATDFRLWVMDALEQLDQSLILLQESLIKKAETHSNIILPGYTHLQPAQPITVGHWLMSFFWMLSRDRERLAQSLVRMSVSPLGSGALSGTPFSINRDALAEELGFLTISQNSLDAVSDRDFVADTLYMIALLSTHLSRFAEDIIIYSNPAFGFIQLNDRYSTGSSLMPQKRNADPMELTRGKTGRLIGNLTGFLATLKSLPSGYNKDLQEDKEAIFDSYDQMMRLLPVITAIIETLAINPAAMRAALSDDMLATEVADYLVNKGMPFRVAHHVVGQLIQVAQQAKCHLSELNLEAMQNVTPLFDEDVFLVFNFDKAVAKRQVSGGTSPQALMDQIALAKALLRP
ncbi:argininosuccinate lyase [Anaerolineales bacterium]